MMVEVLTISINHYCFAELVWVGLTNLILLKIDYLITQQQVEIMLLRELNYWRVHLTHYPKKFKAMLS
jgi:hypothetical protein